MAGESESLEEGGAMLRGFLARCRVLDSSRPDLQKLQNKFVVGIRFCFA